MIRHLKLLQRGKRGQHGLTKIKMQRGLAQRCVGDAASHAQPGTLGQQVVGGQTAAVAAAATAGRGKASRAGPGGRGGRGQGVGTARASQTLQPGVAGRLVVEAGLGALAVRHGRYTLRRQGGPCKVSLI